MHRFRAFLIVPIAILFTVGLIACGGDEGGDEDPQQVLDETFSGEHDFSSGNVDVTFKVSAEGDQGGSLEAGVTGPFQSGENDAFPQFELDADLSLDSPQQDFSVTAGAVSTGDRGFVKFQDTNYEVDPTTFEQVTSTFSNLQQRSNQQKGQDQSTGSQLQALGIDPSGLLTNLESEGNEDVEGTDTIHISGEADIPKLVDAFTKLADEAGSALGGQAPTADQLSQFEDSINTADFDIYTGADDKTLRKLDAKIEIDPAAAQIGGVDNANLEFSISFGDLGEPQSIAAPENPQPLSQLLRQYGIDPNSLGGALGQGLGGGGGGGGGGGAGAPSTPGDEATQAYLECLQNAQGSEALQECSQLLQ